MLRCKTNLTNEFLPFFSSGIFFILPCIDAYARVDLRTRTYDVPPQELSIIASFSSHISQTVKLVKFQEEQFVKQASLSNFLEVFTTSLKHF
jgi:hypothetical protein